MSMLHLHEIRSFDAKNALFLGDQNDFWIIVLQLYDTSKQGKIWHWYKVVS